MSTPPIPPQQQHAALKVEIVQRKDRMHLVSAEQIDDLASLGKTAGIYLAFLTLCIGLAASFGIVLSTAGDVLKASPWLKALYSVALGGSVLVGIMCGALFITHLKGGFARLAALKSGEAASIINYYLPLANLGAPATSPRDDG